ncbi:MAG: phosphoribosylamine--glycine ligase [Acidobacteria bacterium]|nr:phosphoribosylamine--glycine ligase [Acidobacteriota bacterium]MBS1864298.1 phosphoribosylamine--glycine ligase [Acidobacteriota bacterium]
MNVLVIGGGGREHALVWKLRESPRVEKIWCAPGNGGIAAEAECVAIDPGDVAGLTTFAEKNRPDLTVVGPELPLVNGVADAFRARNLPIVGPSQIASQLEGSKIFSKEFLLRHKIPTAKLFGTFEYPEDAAAALKEVQYPLVMKADGLCAGKGVVLATNEDEALAFIDSAMRKNELGPAGRKLMFEETLVGEELSFIILTDGEKYAPLVPTRDHKRIFDENRGPNTGGMGAFSLDELLPNSLRETITRTVVEPTLRGLAADGIRYQGFLYIGLMITSGGPRVLEFNCRLGDPETQAILARLDCDLAEILYDLAVRRFDPAKFRWKAGASVCIVLASEGYPGKYPTGRPISGLTALADKTGVKVLHAGTRLFGDVIATSGGRVLGVTSAAATLDEAVSRAYEAVSSIRFDGMQFRHDIGTQTGLAHSAGN